MSDSSEVFALADIGDEAERERKIALGAGIEPSGISLITWHEYFIAWATAEMQIAFVVVSIVERRVQTRRSE